MSVQETIAYCLASEPPSLAELAAEFEIATSSDEVLTLLTTIQQAIAAYHAAVRALATSHIDQS